MSKFKYIRKAGNRPLRVANKLDFYKFLILRDT